MYEMLIIIGVTAAAFIGTNLDNLLLLAAMYSRYQKHAGMVTAGYFTGIILVAIITIIFSAKSSPLFYWPKPG